MDGSTGDDVDRISALSDNLLQTILSFVREAPAVTATAVLSRRWRHVWNRDRSLPLDDYGIRNRAVPGQHFAGFVDWVDEWIRYGVQRVAGDFCLRIPFAEAESEAEQNAVGLPGYAWVASISLDLSPHGPRLPAVAAYEELTELTLNDVSFREDEQGRAALVLRAEALEELRFFFAFGGLQALDVTAPNLLLLKLELAIGLRVARITAPRLQEISIVRRLGVIHLHMHGQYRHKEDDSFWLLRDCPGVDDVEHAVDATLEGEETFPNVRSMRVKADFNSGDLDHLVASMASLLMRFPRLRSLCIDLIGTKRVKISGFTGASEELDLVSLLFKSSRSVIKSMSLSAASKMRYAMYFKQMMEDEDDDEDADGDDSREPIHVKLMDMSSTKSNRGHWHFGKSVCTWVRYTEKL
ncbi:hypothetical protein SETIT_5G297800v2 [Setaria italica]|uniref:F-box domain-containing protein n=1 Tax=Setaria italica TaxID=4555 RepID=A0A368RA94_SETIT|nr:hypothetical protein SETIT_5G297800v2 [Setaria italica]